MPPPPPVLAPNALEEGGGPAGVVESPPNILGGAAVTEPGVKEPFGVEVVALNSGAPPVEAPNNPVVWPIPEPVGAAVFAGVCTVLPKLLNNEGVPAVLLFSSAFWFEPNCPACCPKMLLAVPLGVAPNSAF